MSPRRAKAVRGRVGDDPATALREHLIETSERLLTERPATTLTTREIARAAGVSDGVLYNHFADKNELVVTALVRRYARLVARFDSGLPRPGDQTVERNLLAFGQAALRMHLEGLPIAVGLLTDPALLRRFVDELHASPHGPQLHQQRVVEYLVAEQGLGRLRGGAPPVAATTLFTGAMMMLALTSVLGARSRDDLFGELPDIVATLLSGLADS